MATSRPDREVPKKNNSLRDFQGVNTQAARQVIGDNQFAWLENVMPVGFGNMPALQGPSAALASWSGAAYHLNTVNILGVNYELVFTTNGALYAVDLGTNVVTTLTAAGTLSGSGADSAQWENSYAAIIDPTNGYFTWDGTTFTKQNGKVTALTVGTIGTGYTSAPTLVFSGGGGTGAAGTIGIQVGLATGTTAGTGYNVGDLVTPVGGTYTTPAQFQVSAVGTGGAITGFNLITTGSYTVAPTNPAATTSPYGTGATLTLNFGVGPILTTVPGSGYTSAPTVTLSGGGGTGGVVTAALAVVPSGGTCIATYAGRVWIASNRTVVFSSPSSVTDFTPANGGGSFVVVDETLHSNITQMLAANNFLYIFGTSSANVVSDVSVNSTGQTVFSNTNLSSIVGTNQPYSVISYYRAVWFANPYGIYALYGSTVQKASADLDGIFPLITTNLKITAATAVLNNILCLCFMFQYTDPVEGNRTLIACFFDKKWFFASQVPSSSQLVSMNTVIVNGSPTIFSTDGSSLFQLFNTPATDVPQTLITKLWDMGDPLANKQLIKIGIEILNKLNPYSIIGTVDTEISGSSVPFSITNDNYIKWQNDSGQIVQWQNNSGDIVEWVASGYQFSPLDLQTVGRYLGFTLNGTSGGIVWEGMHMQYEVRTQWPQMGPM